MKRNKVRKTVLSITLKTVINLVFILKSLLCSVPAVNVFIDPYFQPYQEESVRKKPKTNHFTQENKVKKFTFFFSGIKSDKN